MPQPGFSSLPDELIFRIMSASDPQSRLNFMFVSKRFQKIASDVLLWPDGVLVTQYLQNPEVNEYTTKIRIVNSDPDVVRELVGQVARCFPNIQTLLLDRCHVHAGTSFFAPLSFTKLVEVEFSQVQITNIEHLERSWLEDANLMTNLDVLKFTCCTGLPNDLLYHASQMSALRTVEIRLCSGFTAPPNSLMGNENVYAKWNLKHLHIVGTVPKGFVRPGNLGTWMPRLEHLGLEKMHYLEVMRFGITALPVYLSSFSVAGTRIPFRIPKPDRATYSVIFASWLIDLIKPIRWTCRFVNVSGCMLGLKGREMIRRMLRRSSITS